MAGAFPTLLTRSLSAAGKWRTCYKPDLVHLSPRLAPRAAAKVTVNALTVTTAPALGPTRRTPAGKGEQQAKPKGKAKAKASANPPPKGFDPSWFRAINGKETCMRFAVGKCTKEDCRFFHGCPVPLSNGKACGQPHTALEHGKTPH